MNNIFHGDALDFLKTLEPSSIDCVITDPPYFLDTMGNHWTCEEQRKRKSNSHIKALPIGMKFSCKQGQQLEKFMETIASLLFRALKPGGFFLAFSSPRLYHNMASAIERGGFQIRDQIMWTYKTSQVKAFKQDHIIDNDKVMTDDEKALLKEKLKNHRTPMLKCNHEPICVAMKPIEGRFIDNYRQWGTGLISVLSNGKVCSNVIECSKPSKKEKGDYNDHPTVKPLMLMEELVEVFCPKGGVVVDPFLGSGTTMVAARRKGRECRGSEVNGEYVKIIVERISGL